MQSLINQSVAESLDTILSALAAFNSACSEPGAVIRGVRFNAMDGLPEQNDLGDTTKLLLEAINTWDIAEESSNGSVIRYPGVFEVKLAVMTAAKHLNDAKTNFANTVAALEASGSDSRQVRVAYRSAGMPRIHPLQAWRQIVLLEGQDLSSIGFTVSKMCHSIEVMKHPEAVKRLTQANAFDVIEELSLLPPSSTIHWHTPVSRHIRANVVWQSEETRRARMYHASLPFLVLEGSWPAKRVRFSQPREHAPRRDKKSTTCATFPLRKGSYLAVS